MSLSVMTDFHRLVMNWVTVMDYYNGDHRNISDLVHQFHPK